MFEHSLKEKCIFRDVELHVYCLIVLVNTHLFVCFQILSLTNNIQLILDAVRTSSVVEVQVI